MSKTGGLGDNLYIDGVDVSGDINAVSRVGGGPAALDFTAINKYAFERKGGIRDGSIEFTSFFNPDSISGGDSADGAHTVLSTLPTTNRLVSYYRGTALGGWSAHCLAKQINYDGTRGNDGAFTFQVQAQANGYGVNWAKQLTAGQRTDTTATDGDSVDFGAAASFGLQAYLHVFSFTGTSADIKLQGSSDDGGSDAFADITGGAFTTVTEAGAQRIQTDRDQAVERYLRVVTSGTFSELVFAVAVAVNPVEVDF